MVVVVREVDVVDVVDYYWGADGGGGGSTCMYLSRRRGRRAECSRPRAEYYWYMLPQD